MSACYDTGMSFEQLKDKKTLLLIAIPVLLGLGFLIGILSAPLSGQAIVLDGDCPPDLKFVKPQDDCASFKDASTRMQELQDSLRRQVNGYTDSGRADQVSVFVRDLDTQRFASVNEGEQFSMASLLKVPLAVAYYRLAELTPDLLSQKIAYDGSQDQYALQAIQPPQRLTAGASYTVKDLLYRALAYSDNTAAELLSENFVSYDYLQKILLSVGLTPKDPDAKEYSVTARSMAGVFRALFNSSFLSRSYSNEILKALSESAFDQGSTADLPKGVIVAHKFAERSAIDGATGQVASRELHDCGIVYAANGLGPYSFCIMTEGKDFSNLESIIQNVSLTIYKGIGE